MVRMLVLALAVATASATTSGLDDTDRAAFRSWFTFLAESQFERASPYVVDCAALVRHAYREALRQHSPDWYRRQQLPLMVSYPDVRHPPAATANGWPLFRVAASPDRFAEFADAATIARLNARRVSRDPRSVQPGDLLYFRQDEANSPDHLMVFVGRSRFEPNGDDWLVYHTGPDDRSAGEVRKVALHDLAKHPSPRWRPIASNPAFIGVFRLSILDAER